MTLCKLNDSHNEMVFCDSRHAFTIHRGVFQIPEEKYYVYSEQNSFISHIISVVSSLHNKSSTKYLKVNFVIDWDSLIRLLLWRDDNISVRSAYILFTDAGLKREDIEPFFESSLLDLFLSIYYSKRLDVLRRLCSRAKKTVEHKLSDYSIKSDCHLVPNGFDFIAASSL